MTGDRWIRGATIAAVAMVAIVAAWVSFRHALQVVSDHGEAGWLARAYPLTIDGLIVAASMVLLTAARQRARAHWLAYFALGLGITATIAVNVAAGLAYGAVGAIIAAWPAPALVISFELLMIVVRSLAAEAQINQILVDPVAVPSDVVGAAKASMRATIAAGNPLSANQLQERFSLTRNQATKVRAELLAESNGHAEEVTADGTR